MGVGMSFFSDYPPCSSTQLWSSSWLEAFLGQFRHELTSCRMQLRKGDAFPDLGEEMLVKHITSPTRKNKRKHVFFSKSSFHTKNKSMAWHLPGHCFFHVTQGLPPTGTGMDCLVFSGAGGGHVGLKIRAPRLSDGYGRVPQEIPSTNILSIFILEVKNKHHINFTFKENKKTKHVSTKQPLVSVHQVFGFKVAGLCSTCWRFRSPRRLRSTVRSGSARRSNNLEASGRHKKITRNHST